LAPYALATALGLVPSTVLQVGIGASAGALATWATTFTVVPVVAAAVLVLAGLAALAWRRRRAAAGDPVPAS
jgi:uncharacterized membrane protein YdjX (TVP38/TMEM64 family)